MRHLQTIVTFVVLLTSLAAFADPAPILEVVTNPDNTMTVTTQFGDNVQLAIDPTATPKADPSFLRRLRQELNKIQMEEAQKNQGEGTRHVLRHVKANFIPDSITFAIAGGLVYFTQLQLATKSDPELMVKHIESLKDPIAHISFAAFMVANGIYIDMNTRGLDPMTKQLVMKTLTYKGLAVGSFASSLTADLLVTMKECSKGWIANKNDAASQAACDYSYRQWTNRSKYVGYATQILALIVAQKASEVVEAGAAGIGRTVIKPGAKALESTLVKLLKVSAAHVDLAFSGGTWWIKGIRWGGKLTKFSMFLAVDHYVAPHVNRVGNNLLQPTFFDFDAMALGKSLARGNKHKWNVTQAEKANESFQEFPKQILNFTERMAQWRMHLNAKAEANLAGWLDVSSKLLHQVDYSKNFYLKYVENLFDTLNRQHLVNQGVFNDAPDRAWALERKYPLRLLPLYGVKSGIDFGDEPENDIYMSKPFHLEPAQSEIVQKAALFFYPKLEGFGMSAEHLAEVKKLMGPLTQKLSPVRQGIQLDKINRRYKMIPFIKKNDDPDRGIRTALGQFKSVLGDPKPQLKEGSGFNMAFDTNIGNYQSAQAAGFDLRAKNFVFAKATDLMLLKMICGDKQAEIKEGTFTGVNFYPPRIVNYNGELEICKNTLVGKNTNSDTLHDWKIKLDGKTFENPTRFIMERISPQVLGNWRSEDKLDKGVAFDQWWVKSILPNLQAQLKKMDERYGQVVAEADQQMNNHRSWYDQVIDNVFTGEAYMKDRMILDNNLGDNLRFEFEFYLSVIKTVLLKEKVAAQKTNYEYILEISKRARAKREVVPNVSSENEATRLKAKYKGLFALVKDVTAEDITNVDELSEKLVLPARNLIEEAKKNPKVFPSIALYEQALKGLVAELNVFRVNELEMNYKKLMSLLRQPNIKFDEMVAAKENLYKSNLIVLGPFKLMAELAGAYDLPSDIQAIVAVASGLEALEIEVNRFLLMKVKLADRLEIDMSQLNTFLKYKSIAPPAKQGSASPHNTGSGLHNPSLPEQ
ncbi:MAG: hypothetical protein V4654_07090 [Bdellovibrionota bacterium]